MADEREPKVSQRYRELPGEQPSPELDQAILAAARRSIDKPHAPLVVPAGRHRWYYSLAAAAVVVLAVAVTVHVDRQRQNVEGAPEPAAKPQREPQERPRTQSGAELRRERAAPAAAPAPAPLSPAQELERIVELRRQGRDDEADKALAEFRKRYPGYVIPEEMRAKLERR